VDLLGEAACATIRWRFTTDHARRKLKRLPHTIAAVTQS
jgi:hypothetical protein